MRLAAAMLLAAAAALAPAGASETEPQSRELIGHIGARSALLALYTSALPDGGLRVTGEYVLLPTLQRRFLEGERSPELGVTTLREGTTPILFGRAPVATLQGTWRDGHFRGTRHGPGGQERERFEFSEAFPAMDQYSADVQCALRDAHYTANLAFVVEAGRLRAQSLSWTSRHLPSGHVCVIGGPGVRALSRPGGLHFAVGAGCVVSVRDLGEAVRVSAENCTAHCGSQAYLESVLVDRRGGCQLLRPVAR